MAIRSKHERELIEKRLILELKNIYRLYKEYNPNGEFLNLSVIDNDAKMPAIFLINNEYYGRDKNCPVDVSARDGEIFHREH